MLNWGTQTRVRLPSLALLSLTDKPFMDLWLLFIFIACLLIISFIFLTCASVLSHYIHIISRNSAENIRNGSRYRAFTHHGNILFTLRFFGQVHPKFKMQIWKMLTTHSLLQWNTEYFLHMQSLSFWQKVFISFLYYQQNQINCNIIK